MILKKDSLVTGPEMPLATPELPAPELPAQAVSDIIAMGRYCASHHWLPATSGNFSVRLDADFMAITASGGDKSALTPHDVIQVAILDPDHPRASAEAPLHAALYRGRPEARAIAHVHAPSAVLASIVFADQGAVILQGLELQKALSGIVTHDITVRIPIFANDQDMNGLGRRAEEELGNGQLA